MHRRGGKAMKKQEKWPQNLVDDRQNLSKYKNRKGHNNSQITQHENH